MGNLTVIGMKDLNMKLSKIERSLESIAKSLETIAKVQNRQVPSPRVTTGYSFNELKKREKELKDEEED